ncbi:hypothetical protein AJ78_01421 [Emergomyces pasteurianus Ep9510]|uniref:Uncharacterized protein n=1 Tax=Emergomyces pasteurianus Ep9510 TaxID=1447872 RepID=A0A1J9QRR4_9EURO|nr:hypothetical protein AJ78_01421 [Emergomyces pasteurianus Ep9510]
MATNGNTATDKDGSPESHLAQAFKDIANGEKTASALENHLTSLEEKIEALLAAIENPGNASGNAASKSANPNPEKRTDNDTNSTNTTGLSSE